MSIQQALFAASLQNWELIDTWDVNSQGNSMSFPNVQVGDLYVAFAVNKNDFVLLVDPPLSVEIKVRSINGAGVGYCVIALDATVPAASFNNNSIFDGDGEVAFEAVFWCVFRTTNSFTSGSNVTWKTGSVEEGTTSNSPSHNNNTESFSANSLAFQVVFIERDIPSVDWVPPSGTTLIGDATSSRGAVAIAYQEIGAAGTYSWGGWGQLSQSDNWLSGYVEVTQP